MNPIFGGLPHITRFGENGGNSEFCVSYNCQLKTFQCESQLIPFIR